MISQSFIQYLSSTLQKEKVLTAKIQEITPVSGGSVNQTFKVVSSNESVFLKLNSRSLYPKMFEKEKRGLELLKSSTPLHVPEVLAYGEVEDLAYLVLELIIRKEPHFNFWETFGKGLATLHLNEAEQYGLNHDNYNGSLLQKNDAKSSWLDFFIEQRLHFQEKLAVDNGRVDSEIPKLLNKLYQKLPHLLAIERPSLLHGDLWSGNFMVNQEGQASIMDPAVYYGHREVDISMSLLFGGFDKKFYQSYESVFPLKKGWERRVEIYNLYPLLVHVNLFGSSYSQRVKSILKRLV